MYRCQKCNVVVGPYLKIHRVVVETRAKTYPIFRRSKARRGRVRDAPMELHSTASGFEIVKMLEVCASCAAEVQAQPVTQHAAAPLESTIADQLQADKDDESGEEAAGDA